MLTSEMKKTVDIICETAPMMAMLTSPSSAMAAAFCTAQDFIREGNVEAAVYLLEQHPDFGAHEKVQSGLDEFVSGLIQMLEEEEG